MTNKEAIFVLKKELDGIPSDIDKSAFEKAVDLAIKALDMVEQLKNMRDNAFRLYRVEDGNSDYSYGRKQVLGTIHSDLEELLEVFDKGDRK